MSDVEKSSAIVRAEDNSLQTGISFDEESPEELIPRRGSELVLNCSASTSGEFPDANVTWLKDGRPLVVGANQRRVRLHSSDGSLVVRRVQARADNGEYQCAAAVQGLGVRLSRRTTLHVAGTSALLSRCSQKVFVSGKKSSL